MRAVYQESHHNHNDLTADSRLLIFLITGDSSQDSVLSFTPCSPPSGGEGCYERGEEITNYNPVQDHQVANWFLLLALEFFRLQT